MERPRAVKNLAHELVAGNIDLFNVALGDKIALGVLAVSSRDVHISHESLPPCYV